MKQNLKKKRKYIVVRMRVYTCATEEMSVKYYVVVI